MSPRGSGSWGLSRRRSPQRSAADDGGRGEGGSGAHRLVAGSGARRPAGGFSPLLGQLLVDSVTTGLFSEPSPLEGDGPPAEHQSAAYHRHHSDDDEAEEGEEGIYGAYLASSSARAGRMAAAATTSCEFLPTAESWESGRGARPLFVSRLAAGPGWSLDSER